MNEDFDKCIGLQLKLTKNIMEMEHNKYLKPYGISNEQGFLIKSVYESPGITQTQIAECLNKDKTTITRMINTLVKKGILERRCLDTDRRAFHIYITSETLEAMEKIAPLFEKDHEELEKIIDEKDYEITLKVLNQIKEYYRGLNK